MKPTTRAFFGVIIGILMIVLLVAFVGIEEFINSFMNADPILGSFSVLFALFWLILWSGAFYYIANFTGMNMSFKKSFLTYSSVIFAHNVTPFAHFGGEPVAAEFLSRSVKNNYDRCLGALSAVSAVHFAPSLLFFSLGTIYIFITKNGIPKELTFLMSGFMILAIAMITTVLLVIFYKQSVVSRITILIKYIGSIWNLIPYLSNIQDEQIENSVDGYFNTLMTVTSNRRTVLIAVTLSISGVLCQSVGLWIATKSFGATIPLIYPVVAFPMARMASALPLPGGAGGIEAALITILVALTSSVSITTITASVVLMRGAIYWTPITIGAINIGYIAK